MTTQNADPRDFSERDVVQVAQSYPTKGGGRAMSIRAMRSFFEWASDIDVAEMLLNPARRITVPRPKLGPAARLSQEELEAVWEAAQDIDRRAQPTLVLLYHTGARVGSMCGVRPEHIRFDRHGEPSIYFAVAKGDFPYELPIASPEAVDALISLIDLYRWKPKMAQSRRDTLVGVGEGTVWKWVSEAGRRAGVHAFPHLLRHSMLSDMAADPQVDQRTLIEAANWRDGSQIRRYAAPSEPRIRSAFARLGKDAG
jgi:integrase